ncbi:hypothetical protein [Rhizobium sp. RAF56]|uniref:hypothetical protein n=1 Tax=Rhizobium sp. RAF56 TaxID=3233062 RepID=UPI003F961D8B
MNRVEHFPGKTRFNDPAWIDLGLSDQPQLAAVHLDLLKAAKSLRRPASQTPAVCIHGAGETRQRRHCLIYNGNVGRSFTANNVTTPSRPMADFASLYNAAVEAACAGVPNACIANLGIHPAQSFGVCGTAALLRLRTKTLYPPSSLCGPDTRPDRGITF